jgi:hypothetical protein
MSAREVVYRCIDHSRRYPQLDRTPPGVSVNCRVNRWNSADRRMSKLYPVGALNASPTQPRKYIDPRVKTAIRA